MHKEDWRPLAGVVVQRDASAVPGLTSLHGGCDGGVCLEEEGWENAGHVGETGSATADSKDSILVRSRRKSTGFGSQSLHPAASDSSRLPM